MHYSYLGNSGLKVSRLALGCMSFGDSSKGSHSWTLSPQDSKRLIHSAYDLGINFFDTANIYSLGSSEEILGSTIKESGLRDKVVIATKVYEAMTPGVLSGGLSRKAIFKEVEDSLQRLQTDYIDLYIIHRWDYNTPIEETMCALHDLIKLGKVRYIGASSMHTWQFVKAQYVATLNGWTRFISMQNHYNLINREEEREMIPYCASEGVGVTPWSPLARGKLARKAAGHNSLRSETDQVQSWLYESAKDNDLAIISELSLVASEIGVTQAQLSLAWLLSKPAVCSPIIGVTRLDQLQSLIPSCELKLTDAHRERLERIYLPHSACEYH
jgi:aryl-alcohol dehydrogenase-like predicted oxidoreductase